MGCALATTPLGFSQKILGNHMLEKYSLSDYLDNRLEDQIRWYDKKSRNNQIWFKILRVTEIIFAALIPFFAGYFNDAFFIKILLGILGASVAIIASIIAVFNFQEHWIKYRTTCESLKKEKYLFLTQTEPYNKEDSFEILVKRVETLVSKENSDWSQYIIKQKRSDKNGT